MELIVRSYFDGRGTHHLIRRQFNDAAEVTGANRRALRRISLGKPNPFCPAKIVGFFTLIQSNPFSPPVAWLKQSHAPPGWRAPLRGLAIFIPNFHLPETLPA